MQSRPVTQARVTVVSPKEIPVVGGPAGPACRGAFRRRPRTSATSTMLRDRAGGAASIQRSSPPGPLESRVPLESGVHAGLPGPGRFGLVLVAGQDHGLAGVG